MTIQIKARRKFGDDATFQSCVLICHLCGTLDVSLSNGSAKWAEIQINRTCGGDTKLTDAEHNQTTHSITDLNGRFAGDVRDQEVHSDVFAVDVLVHHVPDGLGHHVGVQVGVVLREYKQRERVR